MSGLLVNQLLLVSVCGAIIPLPLNLGSFTGHMGTGMLGVYEEGML